MVVKGHDKKVKRNIKYKTKQMKKTPFKMNPGFDALPGKVQDKIQGRSPNRFFGGAIGRLFGRGNKSTGSAASQVDPNFRPGRKLTGSNNVMAMGGLGMKSFNPVGPGSLGMGSNYANSPGFLNQAKAMVGNRVNSAKARLMRSLAGPFGRRR